MALRPFSFISAERLCPPAASVDRLDPAVPGRVTIHPAGAVVHPPPRYAFEDDDLMAPGQVSGHPIDLRSHTAHYSSTFLATLPGAVVEKYAAVPTPANTFHVFIDEGVAVAESFHNRTSHEFVSRLMGECLTAPVPGGGSVPVTVVDWAEPDLTVSDPCLLMSSRFIHHNYYHWIFEGLARFWCREHLPDFDSLMLVFPSGEFRPFHTGVLERMGLRNRIMVLNRRLVRFERLWFPSFLDPGTVTARQVEWLRRLMFSAFPAAAAPVRRRRIYVSRCDAKARIVSNEAEVMARLEPLGFTMIVPGRMSLEEQVMAFAGAEMVVAPHGAANASIAFCPPGTPFIELVPAGNRSALYWMQANVGGLPYGRLVCPEDRPGVSMVADPVRLAHLVQQAVKDS